jgi:calcium-dependent protein kinase
MVTGSYPFEAKSQAEIFDKIQYEDYNRKLLENKKCSHEIKDLIDNLLKKKETDRFNVDEALDHDWFKQFNLIESILLDDEILNNLREFTKMNLLQKEILFYIAKISKDEELNKLKKVFGELDKDNTGTLEREEILSAFKQCGIKINNV